jgi:hypothetical protein
MHSFTTSSDGYKVENGWLPYKSLVATSVIIFCHKNPYISEYVCQTNHG